MTTSPYDPQNTLSDQAIDWVVLLHSGTAGPEQQEALAAWLAGGPRHREAFEEASRLWIDMGAAVPVSLISAPIQSRRLPGRRSNAHGRRGIRPAGWAAAVAVFALAVVNLHFLHVTDTLFSDYHTGFGERQRVRLDDGSSVLLNTDTAINLDWQNDRREIRLIRGQALFSVASDPKRPFEVSAEGGVVRALGTVFDVSIQANAVSVMAQQHAVRVQLTAATPSGIDLQAGQRLSYGRNSISAPETVNLSEYTAWQRHKLIFKDRPLAQVISELDRYRSGKIIIANPDLKSLRVTGVFPLDDPDAILTTLQETLAIQSTQLSTWLILLHR